MRHLALTPALPCMSVQAASENWWRLVAGAPVFRGPIYSVFEPDHRVWRERIESIFTGCLLVTTSANEMSPGHVFFTS